MDYVRIYLEHSDNTNYKKRKNNRIYLKLSIIGNNCYRIEKSSTKNIDPKCNMGHILKLKILVFL